MSMIERLRNGGDALLDKTMLLNASKIDYLLREPAWNPADTWVSMRDKVCVVTGANSGLGRVVSTRLAGLGARVYLLCRFAMLNGSDPQFERRPYIGPLAYAESKRALVELTQHWAERLQGSGIAVHTTHPGWSDTPAAWGAVPSLAAPILPLLRTPEQGADTLLWLAVNPSLTELESGQFWFDRRPRATQRLGFGRSSAAERASYWDLCFRLAGCTPGTAAMH